MKPIVGILNRAVNFLLMILLSAMVLIVFYQVFTRYVLGFSSSLLQAFVLVFFVWLGIVGIALGFRSKSHIGVEMFYNLFPRIMRKGCDFFIALLIIGVGLLFFLEGMDLVGITGDSVLPGTSFSLSIMYLCVPVCGILMIVYGILDFVRIFRPESRKV